MAGLERYGINPDADILADFRIYLAELAACPHNLTAVDDPFESVKIHFLDSLSVLQGLSFDDHSSFCDLGSGAGFPLLPLKIVRPGWNVMFIDSRNKSVEFIAQTASKMGITVKTHHGHTSELRKKNPVGQFDEVFVRALGPVERVLEQADFLVTKAGRLVLYKGPAYAEELKAAGHLLGKKFVLEQSLKVEVPFLDRERWIITFRKN